MSAPAQPARTALHVLAALGLALTLAACGGGGGGARVERAVAAELWPDGDVRALAGGRGQRIALIDTGLAPAYAEACPDCRARVDSGDLQDDTGHGTGLAAVISGLPELGWTGLAPDADLTVLALAPAVTDLVRSEMLVAAVDDAVEQGFDVINISMGAQTPDPALRDSIARAIAAGAAVVSAAGAEPDSVVLYPAGFPGVLAAVGDAPHDHATHDHGPDDDTQEPAPTGPDLLDTVAVPLSALELPQYDPATSSFTVGRAEHSSEAAAVLTGLVAGHRSASAACDRAPDLDSYLSVVRRNSATPHALLHDVLPECS